MHFASDVDGVRHVLLDPQDVDLAGWTLETVDGERTHRVEFELQTWFGEKDNWNGLGYGQPYEVWAAVSYLADGPSTWVSPGGQRQSAPPFRSPQT